MGYSWNKDMSIDDQWQSWQDNTDLSKIPDNIKRTGWIKTPLAQAMPDEYKNDDPIVAYRNYVIHEKHYAQWNKKREKPTWWTR